MKIQQWLLKILKKQNVMDGRMHARTDAHTSTHKQRENSIPTTNKVCGGYNKPHFLRAEMIFMHCSLV